MLLYGYENDGGVVGSTTANGTMLRRSDQLLLATENHHFEGSTHLKAKKNHHSDLNDFFPGRPLRYLSHQSRLSTFLRLRMCAAFKVMVLRRQEDLVGPPQHGTIRIIIMFP